MLNCNLQYLTHHLQMYYIFLSIQNVFCTFAPMMRNVPIKISAVVLAVWYLMSIIGFGVHTCMGSQRSFLTSFVSGITCEDIHPEHRCGGSGHCSGHDGCHDCGHGHEAGIPEFGSAPCCSDDFMVITLTGTAPSSENDFHGCHCGHCPFAAELPSDIRTLSAESGTHKINPKPDSGLIAPGDVQSVLGIWRI